MVANWGRVPAAYGDPVTLVNPHVAVSTVNADTVPVPFATYINLPFGCIAIDMGRSSFCENDGDEPGASAPAAVSMLKTSIVTMSWEFATYRQRPAGLAATETGAKPVMKVPTGVSAPLTGSTLYPERLFEF